MTPVAPQVGRLLHRVWRDAPGKFFCVSSKSRDGKWADHFFKRSQLKAEMPDFIEKHRDRDLYWCPHGFRRPRRLKKYAEIPKMLWADLDEANPREMTDFTPTIAWESSPGRYCGIWFLDTFMVEDVNRRLSYHLKADHGGWDLTQVLRIPETNNYKYESAPKVKLLWQDGPTYHLDELVKRLPQEARRSDESMAKGIYRKYEKNFSGWIRRELLRGKPKPGKRSEVLWKLTHELIEAGCSRDEAFELLRVSPWNKFNKRRDGDEQLRRELDKVVDQHLRVVNDENPDHEPIVDDPDDERDEEDDEEYNFLARSMDEVEEENIDWLWKPYLAKGELTILEGDPGLGKSYLAQMIGIAICDGVILPAPKMGKAVTGKVAYFDIENSAGSVTKKRLKSNGCKRMSNFYQEVEPFSVDDEPTLDRVYDAIERLRPTLVVFDTVNTYIGGADTHNSAETQQAFRRFLDIARRFKCAVLVLRHLTKSSKEKALYRGQGSIAFAGLARIVLTMGVMPDDPNTRVVAVSKVNVTRPPKALTFTIEEVPDSVSEQDRSVFRWGGFIDISADEIISAPIMVKDEELEDTVEWLKETLLDEPKTFKQLIRMAEPRSISTRLITRAAQELGINREASPWRLPAEEEEKAS